MTFERYSLFEASAFTSFIPPFFFGIQTSNGSSFGNHHHLLQPK